MSPSYDSCKHFKDLFAQSLITMKILKILTCRLVLWVAVPPPGDGPSFPPGPPTPNIDGLDPKPPDGLLDWTLEGGQKRRSQNKSNNKRNGQPMALAIDTKHLRTDIVTICK